MESIKRFLRDEAATAEATSTAIMIAAVGLLLAAGLTVWYTGLTNFFTSAGTSVNQGAANWPIPGGS